MPWRECSVMEERLRFVARLLEGEGMSEVCREFGVSRKTGYKIFNRYREQGLDALADRSRRPVRYANQLPDPVERLIVDLKRDKPYWGARKIRELLVRKLAGDVRLPAKSTVHAVLDRHGLVKRRQGRRNRAKGTPLSLPGQPNDLWCADYKGEFMLANRRYCYPLTITDFASRYLFACEALSTTKEAYAFTVFERAFKDAVLIPTACLGRVQSQIGALHQTLEFRSMLRRQDDPDTCANRGSMASEVIRRDQLIAYSICD